MFKLNSNEQIKVAHLQKLGVCVPQPSALGPHLVGPRPQKYCKTKYNTIISFWGSYHLNTLN